MPTSRRLFTFGSTAALGTTIAGGLARPALAQSDPIRIGWIGALTGPNSAAGFSFDVGVQYAVAAANAAGGAKRRKIDLLTRDSQSDPTKAVNAAQEMINRSQVHAIVGPVNSGEALATTPIMARAMMPNLHDCIVDSLIDAKKFPNAYRLSAPNRLHDANTRDYALRIRKAKNIAIIGDTAAYGVAAVNASVANFTKDGATIVYRAQIDPSQPDVSADMLRAREAGAELIVFWSDSPGLAARTLNARADWKVPVVGNNGLGSQQVGALLDKPSNWEGVYISSYKSCSYDTAGNFPERTKAFLGRAQAIHYDLRNAQLSWLLCAVDAVNLVVKAVEETGSTEHSAVIGWLNAVAKYPGLYGDYSFSPEQHEGYPAGELIMAAANSSKNGSYMLAPGYSL